MCELGVQIGKLEILDIAVYCNDTDCDECVQPTVMKRFLCKINSTLQERSGLVNRFRPLEGR